ncbi:MAG: hypothetical protein KatS3mg085_093 [Candidatus Dojkabacteria bacterium]|nr:MAG: hypothetical protein KatS3mg085_093 [Candidatus Dojkabacteria bacterium]
MELNYFNESEPNYENRGERIKIINEFMENMFGIREYCDLVRSHFGKYIQTILNGETDPVVISVQHLNVPNVRNIAGAIAASLVGAKYIVLDLNDIFSSQNIEKYRTIIPQVLKFNMPSDRPYIQDKSVRPRISQHKSLHENGGKAGHPLHNHSVVPKNANNMAKTLLGKDTEYNNSDEILDLKDFYTKLMNMYVEMIPVCKVPELDLDAFFKDAVLNILEGLSSPPTENYDQVSLPNKPFGFVIYGEGTTTQYYVVSQGRVFRKMNTYSDGNNEFETVDQNALIEAIRSNETVLCRPTAETYYSGIYPGIFMALNAMLDVDVFWMEDLGGFMINPLQDFINQAQTHGLTLRGVPPEQPYIQEKWQEDVSLLLPSKDVVVAVLEIVNDIFRDAGALQIPDLSQINGYVENTGHYIRLDDNQRSEYVSMIINIHQDAINRIKENKFESKEALLQALQHIIFEIFKFFVDMTNVRKDVPNQQTHSRDVNQLEA